MKKIIFILSTLIIISCVVEDDTNEQIITSETTVNGHVSDIQRNINIENFKVVLYREYYNPNAISYLSDGWVSVIEDSTRTDSNGNYSMTFDYIHGDNYGYIKEYYGRPYYTSHLYNSIIEKGTNNIRDIDAWKPTILKLDLSIINNFDPTLRIGNRIISENENNFSFATIDIYNYQSIDTTAYLRTKPNSEIELYFWYKDGNDIQHQFSQNLMISTQDTIALSYNIDCSTF